MPGWRIFCRPSRRRPQRAGEGPGGEGTLRGGRPGRSRRGAATALGSGGGLDSAGTLGLLINFCSIADLYVEMDQWTMTNLPHEDVSKRRFFGHGARPGDHTVPTADEALEIIQRVYISYAEFITILLP